MYQPTQKDVIARKVADLPLGLYGSHKYLDQKGIPAKLEDLKAHSFLRYDRNDSIIKGFAATGEQVDRSFFQFRSDNQIIVWQMILEGFGLGFAQRQMGDKEPRVKRILPDLPLPTLPVWLAAHEELKTSRRIRHVFDFLADELVRL